MTTAPVLFGAVEAGGTKFVVAIADERGEILAQERFPTTDPTATLAAVIAFLRQGAATRGAFGAIGVACFGPIELDRNAPNYGCIGRTPKAGWSGTDIAGVLAREFSCPSDSTPTPMRQRWPSIAGGRRAASIIWCT